MAAGHREDLMEVLGVNPFNGEIEVKVRPQYAATDSLALIIKPVAKMAGVKKVTVNARMIDDVNRNLRAVFVVLGVVALILLVISLALINNTVHLDIYSTVPHTHNDACRRYGCVHTPTVPCQQCNQRTDCRTDCGYDTCRRHRGHRLGRSCDFIAGDMERGSCRIGRRVLAGMLICLVASVFSTNRYLYASYDDMFK